jgi:hypothetical protein
MRTTLAEDEVAGIPERSAKKGRFRARTQGAIVLCGQTWLWPPAGVSATRQAGEGPIVPGHKKATFSPANPPSTPREGCAHQA